MRVETRRHAPAAPLGGGWYRRLRPAAHEEGDVLALGDVAAVGVAQKALDLLALVALDEGDLGGRVVDEGAADVERLAAPRLTPVAALGPGVVPLDDQQPHRLVLPKVAVDVDDAGGQEARLVEQGAVAARVDIDVAVGLEPVQEPEGAVPVGRGRGQEARVQGHVGPVKLDALDGGPRLRQGVLGVVVVVVPVGVGVVRPGRLDGLDVLGDLADVARVGGAGDDGGHAGRGGQARGDELGRHAARAEGGAGRGGVGVYGCYVLHHLDGLGVRVCAWVLVVQAVDVGHEKQEVRVDHACCDGRQGVVVSKLDLRDGQGVVLIHDWDDAQVQQLVEGVLRVQIP